MRSWRYTRPYAIPGCPRQCGGSLTIDYKAWCTCPVLYFILSPDYVRRLPSFRDSYWTGVQGFQPTVLPPSHVSPLPSRKVFTAQHREWGGFRRMMVEVYIFFLKNIHFYLFSPYS